MSLSACARALISHLFLCFLLLRIRSRFFFFLFHPACSAADGTFIHHLLVVLSLSHTHTQCTHSIHPRLFTIPFFFLCCGCCSIQIFWSKFSCDDRMTSFARERAYVFVCATDGAHNIFLPFDKIHFWCRSNTHSHDRSSASRVIYMRLYATLYTVGGGASTNALNAKSEYLSLMVVGCRRRRRRRGGGSPEIKKYKMFEWSKMRKTYKIPETSKQILVH